MDYPHISQALADNLGIELVRIPSCSFATVLQERPWITQVFHLPSDFTETRALGARPQSGFVENVLYAEEDQPLLGTLCSIWFCKLARPHYEPLKGRLVDPFVLSELLLVAREMATLSLWLTPTLDLHEVGAMGACWLSLREIPPALEDLLTESRGNTVTPTGLPQALRAAYDHPSSGVETSARYWSATWEIQLRFRALYYPSFTGVFDLEDPEVTPQHWNRLAASLGIPFPGVVTGNDVWNIAMQIDVPGVPTSCVARFLMGIDPNLDPTATEPASQSFKTRHNASKTEGVHKGYWGPLVKSVLDEAAFPYREGVVWDAP